MRHASCTLLAVCLGAAGADSFAGDPCGAPNNTSCFIEHDTPGCADAECCQAICEFDSFCCSFSWDDLCVDSALTLCGHCGEPSAGGCFVANNTPGCSLAACCELVCLDDQYCCETAWDEICVFGAAQLCAGCGSDDAGSCFSTHGNPGCEDATCCTDVCLEDPVCCEQSWDSICAQEATVICAGCGSPEAGSCFQSHGGTGCDRSECCTAVCLYDNYCCEQMWDGLCADEAVELCATCGGAGTGDCFTEHGSGGCSIEDCCNAVCAVDPFCCNDAWDGNCVQEAVELCTSCGGAGAGSCFTVNGSPACNDTDCCAQVCAQDSFCCNQGWDSLCVDQAVDLCCANSNCLGDLDANGVVDGADLGLLLGDWGTGGCGDLTGNGTVDGADLGLLLTRWGICVS